jgi:hypothetical protein
VQAGLLAVNGSVTSNITVEPNGLLRGNGTITGSVVNNGTLAPGNSIGTITFNGSYTQAAGSTYQVEVNSTGQSDRINVTGAPGTATINGGTVQVIAAPGSYGRSTTYTILNATGGVTGTYAGVTSNFAFLTPSLSYDANDVFLTLALTSFSNGGLTPNQNAVAIAIDRSSFSAGSDFAAVVGALTGLDTTQGPKALNALSGEPYADFGNMMVSSTAGFMNALGQQMAAARGASAGGARQALAQACDADACDGASPWGVWASALGGLGSTQGNGNASTLTYNFGGAAAGIDYRVDPSVLLGVGAAYTSGSLRVDSFVGQGWSDSVALVALRLVHPVGVLPRCDGGLGPLREPPAAADQLPRPAAHGQRQHHGEPGVRPARDRLQAAGAGDRRRQRDALRPPAAFDDDAERLQRMGGERDRPRRGAPDHDLGPHRPRRRAGERLRARHCPHARPRAGPGLEPRARRHEPADDGGLCRRAVQLLHGLRGHAATGLPGTHQALRLRPALRAL